MSGRKGSVQPGRMRGVSHLLIFLLLVAMFILVTLAAFDYTHGTTAALEGELCQKMLASAEQSRNNLDYRFGQMAESASALIGTLYPYLNSFADTGTQLEEYAIVRQALAGQLERHMITSLRLYVPDEKIYSGQKMTLYSIDPLSELGDGLDPYRQNSVFWQGTHAVGFGFSNPTDVISCAVSVRSKRDYNELSGVLFADMDVSLLREIFVTGSTENDDMFLVDAQGRILAAADSGRLGERGLSEERMAQVLAQGSGYLADPDVIIAFSRLETAEWYVVSTMTRAHMYMLNAGTAGTVMILWGVACLILFTIALIAVSSLNLNRTVSRINAAIRALDAEMPQEPGQTQEPELPAEHAQPARRRRSGGLISLERDTEQIVRSIADVVEERYRDRLAISEYQMQSLQAQIKPHFLYNTLDVIKWMIMDRNFEESVWMVNALSRYLRMSINKGEGIVPLASELELTRIYLDIMQKRFEHRFAVEYDLDDAAMECLIPKLSMQPLVENALLHGILYCDKPEKRLVIRTWRSGRAFGIEIEDNGSGMPEETARRLAQPEVQPGKSYGVANVHKRLEIFGREKCKFYVSSREGVGTCVMIELPLKTKDEV